MAVEVVMPQMGESVVEGTITNWLVKEGDAVVEDQPLVAISTDKVDTEIPSPSAGVIARIVAQEGETLPIGALLAVIETAGGRPAATVATPPPQPSAAEAQQIAVEEKATQAAAPKPAATGATPSGDGRGAPVSGAGVPARLQPRPAEESGPAQRYSPLVLRMASEHAIDLSRIRGTGLGGRVTKRDVMKYLESPAGAAAPASAAAPAPIRPAPTAPQPERIAPGAFRPPIYRFRAGARLSRSTWSIRRPMLRMSARWPKST